MINCLPDKLRELRMKYGLSQREVAAQLGLSPSVISGYETGERTPSTEVLLALSYLYKCSTDYLLGKEPFSPSTVLETNGLTQDQVHALMVLIKTIES